MEEDVVEPRGDMLLLGGMRDPRSTSMRFPHPVPPQCSTCSTAPPPYTPKDTPYGFQLLFEEETKFNNLIGRIMENSTFDDMLMALGFLSSIYRKKEHI
ncbi:unnamed protein product [Urochloa humidicola]